MNEEILKRELERVVCLDGDISITFSLNSPISLNRWLVTSSIHNRNSNLISDIEDIYDREIVSNDDTNENSNTICEDKWRYYVSDEKTSFYKRNSVENMFVEIIKQDHDKDKYIYLLCCLYTEEEKELIVHCSTMVPMPLKVWINGSLVVAECMENFTKNHLFMYRFTKGLNTILVEKPLCLWNRRLNLAPKFFSISIHSFNAVMDNHLANEIDELSLLKQYFLEYDISLNKLIYNANENIQLFITNNRKTSENITVTLENTKEDIVTIQAKTNQVFEFKVHDNFSGIIKVSVGSQYKYIMIGDYVEYVDLIEQGLAALKLTETMDEVKFNASILDFKTGFIKNSLEPIHTYYSQPVFERFFKVKKRMNGRSSGYETIDGFKIMNSPIDNEHFVYYLQLPSGYVEGKKYALVVCLNFDDSVTHIPTNPYRMLQKKSDDVITMTLCGQSEFYRDFLFGVDLQHAIHNIAQMYHVNQERIYLYGICTGAKLGYYLIHKNMYGFTAFFSFLGISNEANLDDHEVPIIQICHIDDMFYNGATIMKEERNNRKVYALSGFEHEEIIDLFCNTNLYRLLTVSNAQQEKKEDKFIHGIRSIYTKQCYVVQTYDIVTELMKKFFVNVQIPLKLRARKYNFPMIKEMELLKENRQNKNIIYIIKKGDANLQLKKINILYEAVEQANALSSEDSFCILCENNPYNEASNILFIIYKSEKSLKLLCDLWSQFDVNTLFDAKSINYDNGKYKTIK